MHLPRPTPPRSPYTTLFRSPCAPPLTSGWWATTTTSRLPAVRNAARTESITAPSVAAGHDDVGPWGFGPSCSHRSEEHTSELQSLTNIVCRLLLDKNKFDHA